MYNMNFCERDGIPLAPNGWQNLLVNPVFETIARQVSKNLDVINNSNLPFNKRKAVNLHDVPVNSPRMWTIDELAEALPLFLGYHIIGIHPKNPFARGELDRFIPGCGKVVTPRKFKEFDTIFLADLGSAIDRTGIDNNDLIDPGVNAVQACLNCVFIVANNHAQ